MVAVATARMFQQAIPYTESTRLDWDLQQFSSVAGPLAINTLVDLFIPGRGTWHVQCQVVIDADTFPDASFPFIMRQNGASGFIHDLTGVGGGAPYGSLESVMALGQAESVALINAKAIAAGPTVYFLWNAKRITR